MRRLVASIALISSVLCGCEGEGGPIAVDCGPLDEFPPVSLVLERRCGTLDCHGNLARPLRIFSAGGLRLVDAKTPDQLVTEIPKAIEEGRVSGGVSTTEAEFEANWRSVCTLEPEKMNQVRSGELQPNDLMLLQKPMGVEYHKGAQLFLQGDAAHTCIVCWVLGFPEELDECQDALQGCASAIQDQL